MYVPADDPVFIYVKIGQNGLRWIRIIQNGIGIQRAVLPGVIGQIIALLKLQIVVGFICRCEAFRYVDILCLLCGGICLPAAIQKKTDPLLCGVDGVSGKCFNPAGAASDGQERCKNDKCPQNEPKCFCPL